MKTLLIGLIALGSVSVFARDCTVDARSAKMQSHRTYELLSVETEALELALMEKGYTIDPQSKIKVDLVTQIEFARVSFVSVKNNKEYMVGQVKLKSNPLKSLWAEADIHPEGVMFQKYIKIIQQNNKNILKRIPECSL